MTQLLVDLPTKFGHVLLGEAEWLRQGQVLAVLGVNKAGRENHLLRIPPSQGPCYTLHRSHSHLTGPLQELPLFTKGAKVPQPGAQSLAKVIVLGTCTGGWKATVLESQGPRTKRPTPTVGWGSQKRTNERHPRFCILTRKVTPCSTSAREPTQGGRAVSRLRPKPVTRLLSAYL